MTDEDQLRDAVAAQLTTPSGEGRPLHTNAETSTWTHYAGNARRSVTRQKIVLRYLDLQTPTREGRSAIVTAGPPGAGKSSLLHTQVPELADYRVLDADIVKDFLIEDAIEDGLYDDLLTRELADGHPLAPRELAALVHRESTFLVEIMRKLCLGRRENIVVEGTLNWHRQGAEIFRQVADAAYSSLEVFGVEVAPQVAHRQARSRWWKGRTAWINRTEPLGGRFTPPDAIDACYPDRHNDAELSHCSQHALELIEFARAGSIPNVAVTIFRRDGDGELAPSIHKEFQL